MVLLQLRDTLELFVKRRAFLQSSRFPISLNWPGRYINGQHCGKLSIELLLLKDTFELFVKRRAFLPSSGFQSLCDMI